MELPKKISPERLKDTIVELRYNTDVPFDYLLGLIYDRLKPVLEPATIPGSQELAFDPFNSIIIGTRKDLFQNQVIRLQIVEGRLIFNSNGEYQGWVAFFEHIQRVLKQLDEKKWLNDISRIGLRYVSEFPDVQIFDNLIWNFEYHWENAPSLNTSFRTEWLDDNDRIIIGLVNNAQRSDGSFSIMDVDVNHTFDKGVGLDQALQTIERLHQKEKSVFFGLMHKEFLISLNPTY